jgi:hypothetical protein
VNVACSSATTDWILNPHGSMPAHEYAVSNGLYHPYDVIFLTIGGDDVYFSDIAEYCLVEPFVIGDHCLANLDRAVEMLQDGSVEHSLTAVLQSIKQRAASYAKIVVLGYPYLIRNRNFKLIDRREASHSGAGKPCGERENGANMG